ncbi:hypothetical protein BKA56DRAFT_699470 [Ilyonectria sp. MPI-CAGE-AT-0026]|nr:hypothetical protein BKA56DRAFT_699470 [Ilyonectria sp. MPI-CAGE-AT-0026]
MASNYVHNHGFSPAGDIDTENEELNQDVRGTKNGTVSCFPHLSRLPVEIRLMIWKTAFDAVDPAVVVCSFSEGRHRASVNHRHAKASRLPPVALACREARREWVRCTRSCRSPGRMPERVYVPRTVFLVPAATVVSSRLRGLSLSITHIAIDIADSPDVFLIFEALARFPRLKTIIIVIPSGAVGETQVVEWQQRLKEDSHALQNIGALVDGPSSDGEWHKGTYLGWLFRNYLEGPQVRAFYARDNSPRVKLFIDRSRRSQSIGGNFEQPWSLFLS